MIQDMTPRGGKRDNSGRPPIGKRPMGSQLVVRLDAKEREELDAAASKQGINVSSMVRRFILEGLKKLRARKK